MFFSVLSHCKNCAHCGSGLAIISLPRIGRFWRLVIRRMVAFGEWWFGEWSPSGIGRSENGVPIYSIQSILSGTLTSLYLNTLNIKSSETHYHHCLHPHNHLLWAFCPECSASFWYHLKLNLNSIFDCIVLPDWFAGRIGSNWV
jgi:hypothetical protein